MSPFPDRGVFYVAERAGTHAHTITIYQYVPRRRAPSYYTCVRENLSDVKRIKTQTMMSLSSLGFADAPLPTEEMFGLLGIDMSVPHPLLSLLAQSSL